MFSSAKHRGPWGACCAECQTNKWPKHSCLHQEPVPCSNRQLPPQKRSDKTFVSWGFCFLGSATHPYFKTESFCKKTESSDSLLMLLALVLLSVPYFMQFLWTFKYSCSSVMREELWTQGFHVFRVPESIPWSRTQSSKPLDYIYRNGAWGKEKAKLKKEKALTSFLREQRTGPKQKHFNRKPTWITHKWEK